MIDTRSARWLGHFGPFGHDQGLFAGDGSTMQGTRLNMCFRPVFHLADRPLGDEARQACLTGEIVKLSALLGDREICEAMADGLYHPAGNVAFTFEGMQAYRDSLKYRIATAVVRLNPLDNHKRIATILEDSPLCLA